MKKTFWRKYGAYFGCIAGALVTQYIIKGKIEYWQYLIVPIGIGFVFNVLAVKLIEWRHKKINGIAKHETDGLDELL